MSDKNQTKHVLVQFVESNLLRAPPIMQVAFESETNGRTDLQVLEKALTKKSNLVKTLSQNGNFIFQKESELFKDIWVTIGDFSPIKTQSAIKCLLLPKQSFSSKYQLDLPPPTPKRSNPGITVKIISSFQITLLYYVNIFWRPRRWAKDSQN